jgi:hypothetical protein
MSLLDRSVSLSLLLYSTLMDTLHLPLVTIPAGPVLIRSTPKIGIGRAGVTRWS